MQRVIIVVLALMFILVIVLLAGSEWYSGQPEFCGSCHIMKRPYNSWAKSAHKDVACIDCHYAPGEKITPKAKFKGLGQLFTYLSSKEDLVRKPAKVSDISCTASECHPREKFMDKKINFTEKIPYVHKTHEDKTIEGQKLHCDTCHVHISGDKHFEVPKEACYLCHFKNTKFNMGRAKCSLCHEIPTKPLQKQKKEDAGPDDKPITHKSLEEAKVSCQSCHYELIQGKGDIKKRECLNCHDKGEALDSLDKENKKEVMHNEHVAAQNANCFNCHDYIQHKEIEFLDPIRETCFVCHPDHHKYQKMLLVGDKRKGIPQISGLMYDVKTNCIGCHIEEKRIKGEIVLHGSPKACTACHTEKHDIMAKEWKDKALEELKNAREVEQEALDAIKSAKGKAPENKLKEAMAMLKQGQKNMQIVEYGGGVHNKKYSIMLLDSAMNNFEDAIDLLGEEE